MNIFYSFIDSFNKHYKSLFYSKIRGFGGIQKTAVRDP